MEILLILHCLLSYLFQLREDSSHVAHNFFANDDREQKLLALVSHEIVPATTALFHVNNFRVSRLFRTRSD